MNKCFHAIVILASVLWLSGCEDNSSRSGPTKPKADASTVKSSLPPPPAPPAPPVPSAPSAPSTTSAPSAPTSSTTPETPQPSPAAQPSIVLKTGVALAQTGLDGTMMMFSVDYEVVQGGSDASDYNWVIERAKGSPAKIKVKMAGKNNLASGLEKWRPEDGPFKSHIEDLKGNRLSESIEMQQ